jgi:hypothetical protein
MTAIDYATRWVVAKTVKNMNEDAVTKFLYEDILMNYGAPLEILSDRCKAIISSGIEQFERQYGIQHLRNLFTIFKLMAWLRGCKR